MSKILSLRRRVYDRIHDEPHGRTTGIGPGVVAIEQNHDIIDPQVAAALTGWRKNSLTPDAIARADGYAIEQPGDVDINEVMYARPQRTWECLGVPVR